MRKIEPNEIEAILGAGHAPEIAEGANWILEIYTMTAAEESMRPDRLDDHEALSQVFKTACDFADALDELPMRAWFRMCREVDDMPPGVIHQGRYTTWHIPSESKPNGQQGFVDEIRRIATATEQLVRGAKKPRRGAHKNDPRDYLLIGSIAKMYEQITESEATSWTNEPSAQDSQFVRLMNLVLVAAGLKEVTWRTIRAVLKKTHLK